MSSNTIIFLTQSVWENGELVSMILWQHSTLCVWAYESIDPYAYVCSQWLISSSLKLIQAVCE